MNSTDVGRMERVSKSQKYVWKFLFKRIFGKIHTPFKQRQSRVTIAHVNSISKPAYGLKKQFVEKKYKKSNAPMTLNDIRNTLVFITSGQLKFAFFLQ